MENWKLQNVDNIEYTPDKSGIYVLINWIVDKESVRLDIMSDNHEPIQSFCGKAENVRKAVMRYLSDGLNFVSLEHAAYIGNELTKADFMRIDYVQDAEVFPSDNSRLTDSELIAKTERVNKAKAEKILQRFSSDNSFVGDFPDVATAKAEIDCINLLK